MEAIAVRSDRTLALLLGDERNKGHRYEQSDRMLLDRLAVTGDGPSEPRS